MKRYNLVLPDDLFDRLQSRAKLDHTSMVELIRRFIKLGLLVSEEEIEVVLRKGGRETEILLL